MKFEAVILDKREFLNQDKTTTLVKLTIMEVATLLHDETYVTKAKADEMGVGEPSATEVVEIELQGTILHPKMKSVMYTGKSLKIGVQK